MTAFQQRFRDAMARVSAPVTIVTTLVAGHPFGTTVSAFASLSLTPPMVVFALDNRGAMRDRIAEVGLVGINILSGDQATIARRFSSSVDRFDGTAWHKFRGVPRLDKVAAFVYCDSIQLLPGGDHTVVLAAAKEAEAQSDTSLSYHLRAFHCLPPQIP